MLLRYGQIVCLTIIFLLENSKITLAQGCSDAGFCTMGAMRPGQTYAKQVNFKLRSIELSQYRGSTTLSPIIYAASVDLNFGISSNTSFQLKLPYQWINGDLGKASGFSDISLSLTATLLDNEKFRLNGTIGGKIPTNKSNLKDPHERVYPMYYQTSLGSYDLVAGASLINKKWLIATGIQIALTENGNHFSYDEWTDYPDQQYIRDHALAYDLKRGVDIMFRVERNFRFSNFNINVGILPIYRINRDRIRDKETRVHLKQDDTNGLALTLIAGLEYHLDVNNSMKFLLGRKYIERDLNPDGLNRHQVLSLSYITRF